MHGLCRAIGAGIPYEFCGRTRILHPMRLCDWGTCEQYLLSQRQDAFDFALESRLSIGKEIRQSLRETGKKRNYLSYEDVNDFTDTPPGIALTSWLCFRGAFEFEDCEQWAQTNPREHSRFCRTRDQISSVDLIAHLDWPISPGKDDTKTNWMSWIRGVSEVMAPGMSPTEVGQLTLYQLRMLTCEAKELEGVTTIPSGEFNEYKRRSETVLI